jgi:23S rRNA pseudouridine955/2504/2580 synthase
MERRVHDEDDGIRLDRWFKRHMPQVAHGLLQKSLRKGAVRLDGKKADASTRLVQGQTLKIPDEWKTLPKEDAERKPKTQMDVSDRDIKEIEQAILFEDDTIIVINKPAGLAAQGGTGQKISVDAILKARAEQLRQQPPRLVHRLDRDTSGVLILGKTANAAAELAQAFARKQAEKYYWALVLRVPNIEAGTIDMPLAKKAVGKDSRYEKVQGDEEDGKNAITNYQVMDRAGQKLAWVELMPVTGRTHQLRVHMAGIGHPILGDGKYGGSESFFEGDSIPKKLHLHARRLVLPLKGRTLMFEAPLTGHMKKSWKLFQFEEPKAKRR